MKEIVDCEVCGGRELVPVLDLGMQPMCDDLVVCGEERVCEEFPVEILFCPTCRTAHQRFQVPKQKLFPSSYHYRARQTGDVLKGMAQLVDAYEENFGTVKGKQVLDIGCNDGSLLSIFESRGATTIGVDPTDACKDAGEHGHRVYQRYFDLKTANEILEDCGHPDIITFTNVFAHIEDLPAVIEALKVLRSEETIIVIENHYLGAVIGRVQFDTFYHEHPRTYSCTSFTRIAASMGVSIQAVEFPSRYGGNIRIFMGASSAADELAAGVEMVLRAEESLLSGMLAMGERVELWRRNMGQRIAGAVAEHGPIVAKAFPGRAAILVKLLGLGTSQISAVHEKPGSMKIGHFVPGTRIPIVSDDDFGELSSVNGPLINFAWHIASEIHGYLRAKGYSGEIIDILDPDTLTGAVSCP
jgi:SAM-dependent methyltransferase